MAAGILLFVFATARDKAGPATDPGAVSPAPGHLPAPGHKPATAPAGDKPALEAASAALDQAFSTNGMDEAVARKTLDDLRVQLKAVSAQANDAYRALCDIHAKAMKEDRQLVELQGVATRKRTELDQLLAKAPEIVELGQKKETLEKERVEAAAERNAAFKRKTELNRNKQETGDASQDGEIARLDKEEQDLNQRLKALLDEVRAASRELAGKRTELAGTDQACAELVAGARDADVALKQRADSLPGIAAQDRICREFGARIEELRTRIFTVSSLVKGFQTASNTAQTTEGSALTNN